MHRSGSRWQITVLAGMLAAGGCLGALDVRRLGAVGDGQTDDTAAIQRALAMAAAGSATPAVLFPRGVYRVTGPLLVPGDSVLEGEPGARLEAAGDHDLLYVHQAGRVLIRNLTFRGGRRHLRISPGKRSLGTVALRGCTFEEAGAAAVDCAGLLAPGSDSPLLPYRIDNGALVPQDESQGRPVLCPLLLHVESCTFRACRSALNTTCELAVVENSSIHSDENMHGAALRSAGRLELVRVTGIAYPAAGRGQHWVSVVSGSASLRDCNFRSHGAWGLCAVQALGEGEGIPTGVVIDGCQFAAAGNEQGCLIYCQRLPNLVAVRNSRELSERTVDILGFAQPVGIEALATRRHDPKRPVPEQFVFDLAEGNAHLAANVPEELATLVATPLPEGTAAGFQTTVYHVRPEHAPLPKRSLSLLDFGAAGDGVADDSAALAKALKKLRAADELVVPAGRYRLARPVRLPPHTTIRGEGWPVFLVSKPAKVGLEAEKSLSLRISGCAFRGGETALRVTTAPDRRSSVELTDCSFVDSSGPAVACFSGAGRAREPNRSRFRAAACQFANCGRVVESNFNRNHLYACAALVGRPTEAQPVIASMGASMVCEGLLGVWLPAAGDAVPDGRWFDAYGRLLCRCLRLIPGERAGDLVRARPGERGEVEIFVEDSDVQRADKGHRGLVVRCETSPRTISMRNCTALPGREEVAAGMPRAKKAPALLVQISANVAPVKPKPPEPEEDD